MKDIFVDTSVAQNFCNPLDEEYKKLLEWLKEEGSLAYNTKFLVEIGRGNQNLSLLINTLIATGRSNHIKPSDLNKFRFTKAQEKSFISNGEDRVHIKTVVLSERKIAIVGDNNLRRDINGLCKYNKIKPTAVSMPSEIDYK